MGLAKFNLEMKKIWQGNPNKIKYENQIHPELGRTISNQVIMVYSSAQGDGEGYSNNLEIFGNCPNNYFVDVHDQYICKPCSYSCLNGCEEYSNYCRECKSGYNRKIEDDKRCYFYTPLGYYFDIGINKYNKCSESCKICYNSPNDCQQKSCQENYFPLYNEKNFIDNLNNSNCFLSNESPDGYYFKDNLHYPCDISCLTCKYSANFCIGCSIDYYSLSDFIYKCSKSSPEGYFLDTKNSIFEKCDVSCSKCEDSPRNCIICAKNFLPSIENSKICINILKPGIYLNLISNIYETCDISCYSCKDLKYNCVKCAKDFYPIENISGDCRNLSFPPKEYYFDKFSEIFKKCDISCLSCENSPYNCSECSSNYFPLADKVNICKNTAPEGYYLDEQIKQFHFCDISCKNCLDSPSNCFSCNTINNYFNLEDKPNTCINFPSDGYYFDNIRKVYKKCDISCRKCIENANKCTFCANDFYFHHEIPFICKNSALSNYFFDEKNKIFRKCSMQCESCTQNQDNCIDCNFKEFYFPLEDDYTKCYLISPDGYWLDFTKKQFVKCSPPCKNCKNKNSCIECINEFYLVKELLENNCLDKCPDYSYPDNYSKECKLCMPSCISCNSEKDCLTCNIGYFLVVEKNKCVKKCPNGFFEKNKICEKCSENCDTCQLTESNCKTCGNNKILDKNLNKCVSQCADGFYSEIVGNFCEVCDKSCLKCKGKYNSDCILCEELKGFKLNSGYCLISCTFPFFRTADSEDCINIKDCFNFIFFNYPRFFSIQQENYIASINYELKDLCSDIGRSLSFRWNRIENSKVSEDNLSIIIPEEKLKDGIIEVFVDIVFEKEIVKSFKGKSLLLTDKVKKF